MAKYLVTADLHLKDWNDKDYTDEGVPLRLVEIIQTFESMCEYAIKNEIDTIVIAGDTNDTKSIVHVTAFTMFRKILEKYSNLNFIFMHGNHDAASGGDGDYESAIELLLGPANVKVLLKPEQRDNIMFVPWSRRMVDYIGESDECDILITHMGLSDATLSNGASIKTRLQSSDLTRFKLVISGHYHKPQQVNHVWYVGSPIQLRRDEFNEDKRFLIIDSETLEVESVSTTGYRRYYQFVIDENSDQEEITKQAIEFKEQGHNVVVRSKIENAPEILKEDSGIILIDEYEEEENVRGITTGMTLQEQMTKYMDIMRVPENDQENYLAVAANVLNQEE